MPSGAPGAHCIGLIEAPPRLAQARRSAMRQAAYMSTPSLPRYQDLLWPTIVALGDLGGSGSIDEIVERVLQLGDYSEDQQAVLHKDGPSTEIESRVAWARTYLKGMGFADNSLRGVWSFTDDGGGLRRSRRSSRGGRRTSSGLASSVDERPMRRVVRPSLTRLSPTS